MRLKCMKLAGFKSFVDPTAVNFPSNLCGVVGPNGCGKSNIIDAVRWVMGESSAKQLRGESITDVIFNGSGGRKPVGQASIELIFDNSEGRITGEYAAFSEISIRRKVSREGVSDYYVNGGKCRRRDVMDIFLGTGLGPRSYSIIEQGMISNMVTARPEDLRIYLEEAAGISKYKERRRETENRMRRTRENLERLTDIREELERVLGRLKRQANAAERYKEYKAEERSSEQQVLALRWRELNAGAEQQREKIRAAEIDIEKQVATSTSAENTIEKMRAQLVEFNESFAEVQGRFYSLGAEIARLEQQVEHHKASARKRSDELQRHLHNHQQISESLQQDRSRRDAWQVELQELEDQRGKAVAQAAAASETLKVAEEQLQLWQAQWETVSREAADARREADLKQSGIQHRESTVKQGADRLIRLQSDVLTDAQVATQAGQVEALESAQKNLTSERESLQQSETETAESVKVLRVSLQETREKLNQTRQQIRADESRRDSLQELYDAALAVDDDSAAGWLGDRGLADAPRMAELLQVSSGWEQAVEMALGSWLTALQSGDLNGVTAEVSSYQGKGLGLFASDQNVVSVSNDELASCVQLPAARNLLAGVFIADSLEAALARRASLAQGQSVITPQGVWLGLDWCRVGSRSASETSILGKKTEIDALGTRLAELAASETGLVKLVDEQVQALARKEQELNQMRAELGVLANRLTQASNSYSAEKSRFEQKLQARAGQMEEIAKLQSQGTQLEAEICSMRSELADLIEQMDQLNQSREKLQETRAGQTQKLAELRQADQSKRQAVQHYEIQEQKVRTQLAAVIEAISRLERQLADIEQQKTALETQADPEQTPIESLEASLKSQLEVRLKIEAEMTAARTAVQNLESELQVQEKAKQQLLAAIQEQRELLQELKLEARELLTRCQTLAEQIESGNPASVLDGLPENADIEAWEEQLSSIRGRIERLGPINLAAIDEFTAESERKSYLDAQNDELEQALSTLENAIRKIDRETRTRFKETFDRVNSGFKTLFPQLFGGGHAYLELTDEDLLETGIGIMARPPGKRNSTVQLLSGGEKALTAIALVFAIFQLNPAPFCMLDEVDAPLDDANVGRFAELVKKMSEQVQFIFITHNKITMEAAGALMGVTMHEAGVSRLVTVDVDKAIELAQA